MYKNVYEDLLKQKENSKLTEETIEKLDAVLDFAKDRPIYEIGMDFGNRLLYLKENGGNVLGGCEFDPMYAVYGNSLNGLFNFGLRIDSHYSIKDFDHFTRYSDKHKFVYTYHFLDRCDESLQQELYEKIMECAEEVLFLEDCLPRLKLKDLYISPEAIEDIQNWDEEK